MSRGLGGQDGKSESRARTKVNESVNEGQGVRKQVSVPERGRLG